MKKQTLNLWIASGNKEKAKELTDFSLAFFPDYNCLSRGPKDVEENESTLEGNAKLKAHALTTELIADGHLDFLVLADDSGLFVDLLEGRPGIYSGRYSGDGANSRGNLEKVLNELKEISLDLNKRTGHYRCSLYFMSIVNGRMTREVSAYGERAGLIALNSKGTSGYAYDSVFLDPVSLKSYGETSYEEKQKDSHRQRAFKHLAEKLAELAL